MFRTNSPCLLAAALLLAGTPVQASPVVGDILRELSQADYQGYVEDLEAFGTRYSGTQGNADATAYVGEVLRGFGLATREHSFVYGGNTLSNVEATLPGLVRPDDILIIGAHFDSIASSSPGNPSATTAPGADDNASGTAGVLEIASVLSRYQFAATIRFIGFNAEEQGMIGSQVYAAQAEAAGEHILAMINLDMIGYVNDGAAEDLDILGNDWLVDLMLANVRAFTTLPVTGHVETPRWSDHQYFAAEEYPGSASVMAIEFDWDEDPGNPYYHQTSDTAATLNYPFALEVSRGAAATVIDLAGLMGVPVPPVWVLLVPGLVLMRRWSRPGVYSVAGR